MCFLQQVFQFWLEQGAAGFAICDTDAAYAEKVTFCSTSSSEQIFLKLIRMHLYHMQTLLEWRGVFKEFSSQGEERYGHTCRGGRFIKMKLQGGCAMCLSLQDSGGEAGAQGSVSSERYAGGCGHEVNSAIVATPPVSQ